MGRYTAAESEIMEMIRDEKRVRDIIKALRVGSRRVIEIKRKMIANGEDIHSKFPRKAMILDNSEGQLRETKKQWILYMNENPFYFEDAFLVSYHKDTVQAIADYEFQDVKCRCCDNVLPRIQCMTAN